MSSAERWRRVEAALDAALNASTGDRAAVIDRMCAGDDALRREVESLLAADRVTNGFLDGSPDAFAASMFGMSAVAPEPANAVVGRYRLIEQIGHGGMGTVWLAERADGQFTQRVALKLIKRGMDSDEILARFLRERQILAQLESPNIARLLDGGVSEDGRPYFVMEYVDGHPITEHSRRHDLGVADRLRLFVTACRAVSYAHRNLVIHSDLKPSNVLVTDSGDVKLLDFGVAKLIGDDEAGMTREAKLMTPEYASPEQRAGGAITTATDVYQLGALLYELVTYRRLHDGPRARLRGDLEIIVTRALRDEPESRYPSAQDLAEDVERHLNDLPIRFGGDRFSYRLRKFVRRNQLTVAASSGVVVLLLGLVSFYTIQLRTERDRARVEAAKSLETAQLLGRFFQNFNPDPTADVEVRADQVVSDAARRAERELGNDSEMLGATLSILGDLQTSLGQYEAADALLTRAIALQANARDANADLAVTLTRRGRFQYLASDYRGAEASLRKAIDLDTRIFGRDHPETQRARIQLGWVLHRQGSAAAGEVMFREVMASERRSGRIDSPLALEASSNVGYMLMEQNRYAEAISILQPTLERQKALFGPMYAPVVHTTRMLSSSLRETGRLDEAESMSRESLRMARGLYGDEHLVTATNIIVLSIILHWREKLDEAETLARWSVAFNERHLGLDNFDTAGRWSALAAVLIDRGKDAEAEQLLRRAYRVMDKAFPAGHAEQADVLNRLAYLLVKRNAPDADEWYRKAVAFDDARAPDAPVFTTDGFHYLAWARQQKGDSAGAERDYRIARTLYERQLPPTHTYRIRTAAKE